MIDTHCHATNPVFRDDLEAVIHRACSAGVSRIICVSESLDDAHAALQLSAAHPSIFSPALGLHPEHVTTLSESQLESQIVAVSRLVRTHHVPVIGEVGLDYTPRVLSTMGDPIRNKQKQRHAFSSFIDLAAEQCVPMTVHSRGAGHHALSQIMEVVTRKPVKAIMHAFDGRAIHAENALKKMPEGLYFSIPPCVVRSDAMTKLVRRLPIERLVLESDAPSLPAVKGERNEPCEIQRAAEMVAAVKGLQQSFVQNVMNENDAHLFPSFFEEKPKG